MSKQITKKTEAQVRSIVVNMHSAKGAERKALLAKAEELVKEYEFDLKAFIKSLKPRSRRSLIIDYVQEGIWDTQSLAEALTLHGYPDSGANAKAISGTLYDMKMNQDWIVRAERTTDKVTDRGIFVELP